jgi:hypothetical protein
VFYVVLGFVWFGNHSIVKWNLDAQRLPQFMEIRAPQ